MLRSDIIIPVWNQCALTKDCLASIEAHTDPASYRLIIVDNASDTPTRDFLQSYAAAHPAEAVQLIRNEENLGFIKATNQGMVASSAPYVVLLNNDTVVTAGWLDEMVAIAESAPAIGIVNPSSNNLGQKPASGESVEQVADRMRREKAHASELGAALGFCMLIKRRVIEKIGLLDEIYGMGNFEDTDYSRRAINEGFRCVRANGAYVYHRENTSFKLRHTFDDDFKRNREIFEFRWGKPKRIAHIIDTDDMSFLPQLNATALGAARRGDWIWYFMKRELVLPAHSNIRGVVLPVRHFYPAVFWQIIKRKKKFSEVTVSTLWFGRVLEAFSFIHKATITYQ